MAEQIVIRQLALSKRVANRIPRFYSNGDAGFTVVQVRAGRRVCYTWADSLEWRNGVGFAVLIEVLPGQNVWIAARQEDTSDVPYALLA